MQYYSHGKLLLTGEYAVLDGALSLAVPTALGQRLGISPNGKTNLHWTSCDLHGNVWFENTLFEDKSADNVSVTLEKILSTAGMLNPEFVSKLQGVDVRTDLEFERTWGLGSSSTLISNIARWAGVDAYELLFKSFGGSGYDIACAVHDTPVLYRLANGEPKAYPVDFSPEFINQIHFVHLNQKQNSKEGIARYRAIRKSKKTLIDGITAITEECIRTCSISQFCELIDTHETLVADYLQLPKVKELYFSDFEGSIKSLGAWGGDFVMAVSEREPAFVKHYFEDKGFATVVAYSEMIFQE
ncbi:MAG: GYDIA family GHMP kinase [Capnocytophaga sp.]|nr:GYDIA family GHMP kinase [Capnocytophaga sp.]